MDEFFDKDRMEEYHKLIDNWDSPEPPPTFMEFAGSANRATNLIKEIRKNLENRKFESAEELNKYYQSFEERMNSKPNDDFLGLSPDRMHDILHSPFGSSNLVSAGFKITGNDISKIPIMKQALYFLTALKDIEPLKATKPGNLPRKFVIDLYENIYKSYDLDIMMIDAHRHLLTMAGFIKKYKSSFSLTLKGKKVLENRDYNTLYEGLFNTFASIFNWEFLDGYGGFNLIQSALVFNLYILKIKAGDFKSGKELGALFLKAFPVLKESGEDVINCFCLRFLKRFCLSFGLLDLKKAEFYKTSELFERLFKWTL